MHEQHSSACGFPYAISVRDCGAHGLGIVEDDYSASSFVGLQAHLVQYFLDRVYPYDRSSRPVIGALADAYYPNVGMLTLGDTGALEALATG